MWNLELDIVSFTGPHVTDIPCFYQEMFHVQFPEQVKQVRSLACAQVVGEGYRTISGTTVQQDRPGLRA